MDTSQRFCLDRRAFLGTAALGTIAATALISGCNNSEQVADGVGSTESKPVQTKKPSETLDCDVLVLGAGGAGLWAAIEACRAGKRGIGAE